MARMPEHSGSDFPRAKHGIFSERRGATAEGWSILTVIRPAGVQEVVPIRSEGHVQDTPAHIPGLDAFEFMEAAIPTVIQSDCLICRVDFRQSYGLFSLQSRLHQISFAWCVYGLPLSRESCSGLNISRPGFEFPGSEAF